MGDPIRYKEKQVAYYSCVNAGKVNQGYTVRFESLEDMVKVLSLSDEEILDFGDPSNIITVKKFKENFIINNGVFLFSSQDMQERSKGFIPTEEGKAVAEDILEKAGYYKIK